MKVIYEGMFREGGSDVKQIILKETFTLRNIDCLIKTDIIDLKKILYFKTTCQKVD